LSRYLLDNGYVAEILERRRFGCLGRFASVNALLALHCKMRAYFFVETGVGFGAAE
jgi:hypothetical protein